MDFFRLLYTRLSSVNFAHLLVLGLVVKALASDISYAAFLLTVPILAFEAYKLYIASKKPDAVKLDAELVKELDNIKAKLNAQTLEKNVKSPMTRYF